MKKNDTVAAAKKARKAFKKELTEKIITQLKAVVAETGTDSKKSAKAIEKAAKNLAKKLAKEGAGKNTATNTVKIQDAKPVVADTPAKPVKAKATPAKKAVTEAK